MKRLAKGNGLRDRVSENEELKKGLLDRKGLGIK